MDPPTAPNGSSVTASPGVGVPTRDGVLVCVFASLSFSNSDGSRRVEEVLPRAREGERVTGEAERRTAEVRVRDSAASWESMSPMWDSRTPLRRENIVVVGVGEGRESPRVQWVMESWRLGGVAYAIWEGMQTGSL